jgi:hypothetical protein
MKVWSAPWLILACVWTAGRVAAYAEVGPDGMPKFWYMAPDGRMHSRPPAGAAAALQPPVEMGEE